MTPPPAHHRPGGFRNPWPLAGQHGVGGVARWMVERFVARLRGRLPRDPDPAVFARAAPLIERPRARSGTLRATWVGHSTFLLQVGNVNLLTDPMWGERASPLSFAGPKRWTAPGIELQALPPIDVVLLSHDHYDHLDRGTVRWLATHHPGARWCAPRGVAARLRAFGVALVSELDWWDTAHAAGLDILCTPARHFGRVVATAAWRDAGDRCTGADLTSAPVR